MMDGMILRGLAFAVLALAAVEGASGQERPPPEPGDSIGLPGLSEPDSVPMATEPRPLGALARSLVVPGWGHAYAGATTRGGIYLAFEAASAYAVIRTRSRLTEVDARLAVLEGSLRAELAAQGITHSDYVNGVLEGDEAIADLRELSEERRQQVEDWLAFGGFMFLLGAADAFVSTHLREVPQPIDLGLAAAGNGRVEISFRLPIRGARERVGIEPTGPGFSRAARF